VVEFERLVVVLEGKRTEAGPTTNTFFMPVRHQMLRHMDAAREFYGRPVIGLFAVEGADGTAALPPEWSVWACATVGFEVVRRSLPHRSADEQEQIVRGFAGAVTWGAIVAHFGLGAGVLLDLAPGWECGPNDMPVWTGLK
jgi:hypothetical protein